MLCYLLTYRLSDHSCPQCFDADDSVTGRASDLYKVLPQWCSWITMTAWWQHGVPSEEHRYPSVFWRCRFGDRKGIWLVKSSATTMFLAHDDSKVAPCCLQVRKEVQRSQCSWSIVAAWCPQSGTLSPFNALTLLVGWQERHATCKKTSSFKTPCISGKPADLGFPGKWPLNSVRVCGHLGSVVLIMFEQNFLSWGLITRKSYDYLTMW